MREQVESIVSRAVQTAIEEGQLTAQQPPAPCVERPRDLSHGDWASSVALKNAKLFHRAPRDAAVVIASHLENDPLVAQVEVAGPGFINIRLVPAALQQVIADVRQQGANYGRCDLGEGRSVQVEFVSANPTGPMHVGHGRWAALGDSLANLLEFSGWKVEREFLINDAGNQMDIFAFSVDVRYRQICRLMEEGKSEQEACDVLVDDAALPPEERTYGAELGEKAYGGAYVVDIAQRILDAEGTVWMDRSEGEREAHFKESAYAQVLEHMKGVLARCGVNFDVWFSERVLHAPDTDGTSAIERAIAKLDDEGYIYQKDGATWFRSTDLGDDKDRVLIKADGDCTYFAADIAYHADKFSRGFDRVIDIWGADHHGYVARMQAACTALGFSGRLDVILGQLVNLLRGGKPVRLSKRAGTMVTFEELLDLVGSDATRYLMVAKSADQTIDFDIDEARKQDSTNPVFYVQYAHARICSILRKGAGIEDASTVDADGMEELTERLIGQGANLALLVDASELELMRKLDEFPEVIESASRDSAPFRLTHYAEDLASTFHQFYTRCHVLTDDPELTRARLAAVDAARIVLSSTLRLLGVSAPVSM